MYVSWVFGCRLGVWMDAGWVYGWMQAGCMNAGCVYGCRLGMWMQAGNVDAGWVCGCRLGVWIKAGCVDVGWVYGWMDAGWVCGWMDADWVCDAGCVYGWRLGMWMQAGYVEAGWVYGYCDTGICVPTPVPGYAGHFQVILPWLATICLTPYHTSQTITPFTLPGFPPSCPPKILTLSASFLPLSTPIERLHLPSFSTLLSWSLKFWLAHKMFDLIWCGLNLC